MPALKRARLRANKHVLASAQCSNEGGVRIFLSYGHDQNAPLVERIAADLRAAGHEVWIDTAEIKGGQD